MSAITDIGIGAAGSVTERTEPAYLKIKDYRSIADPKETDEVKVAKTLSALSGNLNSLVSSVANAADKKFQVQFNPSELQIYATNLKVDKADTRTIDDNNRALSDSALSSTVELTVNLIFDHVNIYDAFMMDKVGLSATGLTNAASAIASAAGKTWTVQTEVEGLISALRNKYTRSITFMWANFSFVGVLRNVNAQYTMFSVSGRPIRAKVMLRLRQEINTKTLNSWQDDFDKAFGGDTTNLVSFEQNISSLINVDL